MPFQSFLPNPLTLEGELAAHDPSLLPSWRPWLVGLVLILLCSAGSAHAQTNPYSRSLSRHQISAVAPPTPAKDFSLPTLGGPKRALSDSRGHWVLLTFFATWCGPCKSELPTIQRLFEAEQGRDTKDRVHILGVAIEPDPGPVRPFAKKLGITFPVLVDTTSSVASTYRAQSIPVSYLISPDGAVVGVSRGARDWSQATTLFNELTESKVEAPTVAGGYQSSVGGPVQLPSDLTPPTATAVLAEKTPEAAKPFTLRVEVNWAGNLREYVLRPPEVSLPEGVTTLQTSAHTSSRDGRALVTYDIALKAMEPGSYVLDPVEIRYTPLGREQILSARIEGPTVVVETARYAGLTTMGWLLGLAGLVVLLGAGLVGRWALGRTSHAEEAPTDPLEGWQKTLEEARAKRIRGDYVGCLEALAELEGSIGPARGAAGGDAAYAPPDDIRELLEAARYGGQAPPKDVLDRLQRRVERALAELSGAK